MLNVIQQHVILFHTIQHNNNYNVENDSSSSSSSSFNYLSQFGALQSEYFSLIDQQFDQSDQSDLHNNNNNNNDNDVTLINSKQLFVIIEEIIHIIIHQYITQQIISLHVFNTNNDVNDDDALLQPQQHIMLNQTSFNSSRTHNSNIVLIDTIMTYLMNFYKFICHHSSCGSRKSKEIIFSQKDTNEIIFSQKDTEKNNSDESQNFDFTQSKSNSIHPDSSTTFTTCIQSGLALKDVQFNQFNDTILLFDILSSFLNCLEKIISTTILPLFKSYQDVNMVDNHQDGVKVLVRQCIVEFNSYLTIKMNNLITKSLRISIITHSNIHNMSYVDRKLHFPLINAIFSLFGTHLGDEFQQCLGHACIHSKKHDDDNDDNCDISQFIEISKQNHCTGGILYNDGDNMGQNDKTYGVNDNNVSAIVGNYHNYDNNQENGDDYGHVFDDRIDIIIGIIDVVIRMIKDCFYYQGHYKMIPNKMIQKDFQGDYKMIPNDYCIDSTTRSFIQLDTINTISTMSNHQNQGVELEQITTLLEQNLHLFTTLTTSLQSIIDINVANLCRFFFTHKEKDHQVCRNCDDKNNCQHYKDENNDGSSHKDENQNNNNENGNENNYQKYNNNKNDFQFKTKLNYIITLIYTILSIYDFRNYLTDPNNHISTVFLNNINTTTHQTHNNERDQQHHQQQDQPKHHQQQHQQQHHQQQQYFHSVTNDPQSKHSLNNDYSIHIDTLRTLIGTLFHTLGFMYCIYDGIMSENERIEKTNEIYNEMIENEQIENDDNFYHYNNNDNNNNSSFSPLTSSSSSLFTMNLFYSLIYMDNTTRGSCLFLLHKFISSDKFHSLRIEQEKITKNKFDKNSEQKNKQKSDEQNEQKLPLLVLNHNNQLYSQSKLNLHHKLPQSYSPPSLSPLLLLPFLLITSNWNIDAIVELTLYESLTTSKLILQWCEAVNDAFYHLIIDPIDSNNIVSSNNNNNDQDYTQTISLIASNTTKVINNNNNNINSITSNLTTLKHIEKNSNNPSTLGNSTQAQKVTNFDQNQDSLLQGTRINNTLFTQSHIQIIIAIIHYSILELIGDNTVPFQQHDDGLIFQLLLQSNPQFKQFYQFISSLLHFSSIFHSYPSCIDIIDLQDYYDNNNNNNITPITPPVIINETKFDINNNNTHHVSINNNIIVQPMKPHPSIPSLIDDYSEDSDSDDDDDDGSGDDDILHTNIENKPDAHHHHHHDDHHHQNTFQSTITTTTTTMTFQDSINTNSSLSDVNTNNQFKDTLFDTVLNQDEERNLILAILSSSITQHEDTQITSYILLQDITGIKDVLNMMLGSNYSLVREKIDQNCAELGDIALLSGQNCAELGSDIDIISPNSDNLTTTSQLKCVYDNIDGDFATGDQFDAYGGDLSEENDDECFKIHTKRQKINTNDNDVELNETVSLVYDNNCDQNYVIDNKDIVVESYSSVKPSFLKKLTKINHLTPSYLNVLSHFILLLLSIHHSLSYFIERVCLSDDIIQNSQMINTMKHTLKYFDLILSNIYLRLPLFVPI